MCDFVDSPNTTNSSKLGIDYFYHEINGGLKYLEYVMSNIIMPVVSVLGIVGNILSFLVFQRHGLAKSCNILILSLAVGDTMLLLGINNVPILIYMNNHFGFPYSKLASEVMFDFYQIQRGIYVTGRFLSTLLPMFITLERFVAIFFPLRFSRIISTLRTKVAVGFLFIASFPFAVYFALLTRFVYQEDTEVNCGRVIKSSTLLSKPGDYSIIVNTYVTLTGSFPVFVVLTGCFVIAIKIRILATRRKQLTNTTSTKNVTKSNERITGTGNSLEHNDNDVDLESARKFSTFIAQFTDKISIFNVKSRNPIKEHGETWKKVQNPHRTTRTLLSVCLLYSVVYTFKMAIGFIFGADDWSSDYRGVLTCFGNLAMSINSSANFLIYVALNPKFRQSLKVIFSCGKEQSTNNRLPNLA